MTYKKNTVNISKIFLVIFLVFFCSSCLFQPSQKKTAKTSGGTVKSLPNAQDALNAVFSEDTKTLALILEKVPDLANTKDSEGYSLLHIAIWKNNARIAKILLGTKADPNARSKYGFTAVHELLRCDESNDRKEILEMMILRRADVNALTESGNTPLDIAEIQDKQDFARVLKHYGAKRAKQTIDLPPVPDFAKNSNEIPE